MFRPVSSPNRLFDEYNRDNRDRQLRQDALRRFGVAEDRPQDLNAAFMRGVRRVNLGIVPPFPENYEQSLFDWIGQMPRLINIPANILYRGNVFTVPLQRDDLILLQDKSNQNLEVLKDLKPLPDTCSVLGVEFQLQNEYSYDGFMCSASIASPLTTVVVDLLDDNTEFARSWMTKMFTGKRTLKVLIGCENYIYRLQKDWGCFPIGVLDLHDLFTVWKNIDRTDCYATCRNALEGRLRRRGITDGALLDAYFGDLFTPGVGLLTEIFDLPVKTPACLKFADFRKRPFNKELVKLSAQTSFLILRAFYNLKAKVGNDGVRAALELTTRKLLNRSNRPRYEGNLITTDAGQFVVEQILKWREYLALNLDKPVEQILLNRQVPALANSIHTIVGEKTVPVISRHLAQHKVDDDFQKAAKLLIAYLEEEGTQLQHMTTVICHTCFTKGHVAKFCFREPEPVAKKDFMNRPENAWMKSKQNERRHINWCVKRNLDPYTTVCPWESKNE